MSVYSFFQFIVFICIEKLRKSCKAFFYRTIDGRLWSSQGLPETLICGMTSQDHLIEGSCEFTEGSFLRYVTTQTILATIGIVKVRYILICYMTSRGQMFKGLCYFTGRSFMVSHHLPKLVATDCVKGEL